ncbi:MAG: hypothetical protein H7257_14505 [Taibaiella sp.]|nr:hypothetical protein [Taibaiella sp.]
MSAIKTRRDYHLTRFKIERFLEKGFENLTLEEEEQLHNLSKEMTRYEMVHFPVQLKKPAVTSGNADKEE